MKRIEMQDTDLVLTDLKYLTILGKGTFGTVFLVADKYKNRLFALKVIPKIEIQKHELQECISLEIKILMALDHEFIMKLVKSYEDDRGIYLLTEYVKGFDFFNVMRALDHVSEEDSMFYISCLILVLEYLHEREIVYRDLKPENIVIDEEGYPKLIDFGTSKFLNDRTYTMIGTPHYMAPEIILGTGYSFYVDY